MVFDRIVISLLIARINCLTLRPYKLPKFNREWAGEMPCPDVRSTNIISTTACFHNEVQMYSFNHGTDTDPKSLIYSCIYDILATK